MTQGAPRDRHQRVLWYICVHGLHQLPRQMSHRDVAAQSAIVHRILDDEDGIPTRVICDAIQYGMPNIFPVTENGYFDARDVERYLHKAKAVAAALRDRGKIPTTPEAAHDRIERMAEGDEWNE